MKILDINNQEIQNPDLKLGYLQDDKVFLKSHVAIPYNPGKWHYVTIAEYPNGGKDVKKVYDEPEIQAQSAWDEYENIQRYIEYTPQQIEEMNRPSLNERLDTLEEQNQKLQAQNDELTLALADVYGGNTQ